jgi:hypothetical protein
MENDYGADLGEIFQVIDTAEVLVVRFAIMQQRLLVDARSTESEGPLIQLVPPAGSAEERFRHLKKLRPEIPVPERILTFMWPRQVDALQASGVWQRIVDRMTCTGGSGMEERCREVLRELAEAEHEQVVAAIRGGPSFKSLWERPG